MKVMGNVGLSDRRKAWIGEAQALLPLFTVWGFQWILNAGLDIAEEWVHLRWARQVILLLAVAASVGLLWREGKLVQRAKLQPLTSSERMQYRDSGGKSLRSSSGINALLLLLSPGIMLVTALWLLETIGALEPFFIPLFRAFILAIGFVILGILLGRPLIYLGMWLFALAAIAGVWYLGYSYVVMEGMGGISLLIGGWMLRTWAK